MVELRLLWSLVERDIKARYKQTVASYAWAILQPLIMMVVFSLFFGRLLQIGSGDVPYPIFVYAGLVPWTLFANGVTRATNSLVADPALVTRVKIDRSLLPASAVLSPLLDFALAFLVLLGMMFFYRTSLTWHIVYVIPLTGLAVLFAYGIGFWLAALQAQFRDIGWTLGLILQMAMFATPVVYESALLSTGGWQWLLYLNPMAFVVDGFRYALLGMDAPVGYSFCAVGVAVVVWAFGDWFFQRREPYLADIV